VNGTTVTIVGNLTDDSELRYAVRCRARAAVCSGAQTASRCRSCPTPGGYGRTRQSSPGTGAWHQPADASGETSIQGRSAAVWWPSHAVTRTVTEVDGQVAGWVFLPDDGPRMHRTDRTGAGHTLCGRHLDETVPVLQNPRRAFSICMACRGAGAEYPIPHPAAAGGPLERKPQQRVVEGPLGWVQLPKPALRVLHRPDPYIPDRVLCGLKLPGRVPIHQTPPSDWAHCDSCQAKIAADPEEARRDRRERPTPAENAGRGGQRRELRPRPRAVSERIRERLAARPVVGDGPVGTAGTWRVPVGWVRLRNQAVWHRPHPERSDHVMCELPLPAAASVYPRRITKEPICPDCHAVRTQALKELRELDRLLPPPAPRSTTRQPPRPQIVRGGLPTLGRDR
jgi:hypothetical protein